MSIRHIQNYTAISSSWSEPLLVLWLSSSLSLVSSLPLNRLQFLDYKLTT
jgi:hypothetical protein